MCGLEVCHNKESTGNSSQTISLYQHECTHGVCMVAAVVVGCSMCRKRHPVPGRVRGISAALKLALRHSNLRDMLVLRCCGAGLAGWLAPARTSYSSWLDQSMMWLCMRYCTVSMQLAASPRRCCRRSNSVQERPARAAASLRTVGGN